MAISRLGKSALFTPLKIGDIELAHRIIYAPLTRFRAAPASEDECTEQDPSKTFIPDAVNAEYYAQRASPGGLLITEATKISLEAGVTYGVPGIYLPCHIKGWQKVTKAVHDKGGYIYCQLWHAGRATSSIDSGIQCVSSGDQAIEERHGYGMFVGDAYQPRALTKDDIKRVVEEFADCAEKAVNEAGFNGIELHGANSYLFDQFHCSNINNRTDEYGGTVENRCRFTLEVIDAVVARIGQGKTAIRLSPFALILGNEDSNRLETWSYLCKEIKKRWSLSYVHFMEPRFDEIVAVETKQDFMKSWGLGDNITLAPFRKILGDTPLISAGGWNNENSLGVVESGAVDALGYGRYMLSTPDFVDRLKKGLRLNKYNRATFYGPADPTVLRQVGYTDYPTWAEVQGLESAKAEQVLVKADDSTRFQEEVRIFGGQAD